MLSATVCSARKTCSTIGKRKICGSTSKGTMDSSKFVFRNCVYLELPFTVHPTLPYVLSASDDMLIKLWDWEKGWECTQTFQGHAHYSDGKWHLVPRRKHFCKAILPVFRFGISAHLRQNFTLDGHSKGVNCIDYFMRGSKPYLISGSDDHTAKVWDYEAKSCVQTLEGHTNNVSAVCVHSELPLIITGSEDGMFTIWDGATYRLENTLNYGFERVWAFGCMKGSNRM
ncbi:Coatomer subunit beta'-1 [Vitis vinifera]|uniref:Coatomer subunit beta'-1 n=1 Tax=Vitis vinifera TaxID=29760 RepID=A0A438IWQ6_VITVI|nr:Coatomer subunit beta'-1 [Vitis vinifera]